MKSLTIITTMLATCVLGACGGNGSEQVAHFMPPITSDTGADGWTPYIDPPTIDAQSAAGLAPGAASPEAVVTHFYASRIRDDRRYREVLPSDPSARLERGLHKLDDWTFRSFRLIARKETSADGAWVKIWFEIETNGAIDSGTDEVDVRRENGKWTITGVPT